MEFALKTDTNDFIRPKVTFTQDSGTDSHQTKELHFLDKENPKRGHKNNETASFTDRILFLKIGFWISTLRILKSCGSFSIFSKYLQIVSKLISTEILSLEVVNFKTHSQSCSAFSSTSNNLKK
jgi:hypothetical protein